MANPTPPNPVEFLDRDCILRKRLNSLAYLNTSFSLGWDPQKDQWVIKYPDSIETFTGDGGVMISRKELP